MGIFLFALTAGQLPFLWMLKKRFSLDELRVCFLSSGLQTIIALLIVLLLDVTISPNRHRRARMVFDGMCALCLVVLCLNLPIFNQLQMHFLEALCLNLERGFGDFIMMLKISGMPLWGIVVFFLFIAIVPALGIVAFRKTRLVSARKTATASLWEIGVMMLAATVLLFLVQAHERRSADIRTWLKQRQVMPLSFSFFRLPDNVAPLTVETRRLPSAEAVNRAIDSMTVTKRPEHDIFLFVYESLRQDALNEEMAPNFHRFKRDCVEPRESVASANATHLSWYSLFHSRHALHCAEATRDRERWGAPPLRALRKLGYAIHVLAASEIRYYNMNEIIFGAGQELADSVVIDPKSPESDRRMTTSLIEQIRTQSDQPRLFVVFMEAAHHAYNWPSDYPAQFEPYTRMVNYLKTGDGSVEGLWNRYRNSIHYLDHLFGSFISALKETGAYEEATIVVTGDHGEEFMEFGHLLHSTDLNHIQTRVPLLFKWPASHAEDSVGSTPSLGSHTEVFPSILERLGITDPSGIVFDGVPISEGRPSVVMTTDKGWGSQPDRFVLNNGVKKLFIQFLRDGRGEEAAQLFCFKSTDLKDKRLRPEEEEDNLEEVARNEFGQALETILARIEWP